MQTLDIISVNIWQIVISLCNLVLIFLMLKKFMYKPVTKMLNKRQATLDEQYGKAAEAEKQANDMKNEWEAHMASAKSEADAVLKSATESAERRSQAILDETRTKAEGILRRAETDAELERKKAEAGIKKEIVEVSTALSEKMLGREIQTEDHRALIDSFISEIGEDA